VSIGDKVRATRKAAGISQEEVARRAGVSLNVINRLERGVILDPHYSTLRGIARALGVLVEDLVREPAGKAGAPETGQRNREAERHFFLEHVRELEPGQLDRQVAGYDDAYLDVLAEFDQIPPDAPEFAEHAALLEQTATRGLMLRLQRRVLAGETNLIYLLDTLVR
jgi:transcriptional regulator with XRE-family HTH domain